MLDAFSYCSTAFWVESWFRIRLDTFSQGRHGEFKPDKAQYSTPNFFDRLFFIKVYWTQNLGKVQALGALPAVAPMFHIVVACKMLFNSVRKEVTVSFLLSYMVR